MTYYLVKYYDQDLRCPEYFWTNNPVILELFFKEYPHIEVQSDITVYEDCKNDMEFFSLAIEDSHKDISQYNELYIITSEHDPDVYHVTTPKIDDDNVSGGVTDDTWRSITYGIVKSAMNLSMLIPYMKEPQFATMMKMTMMKFVAQYILLNEGVICDYYDDAGGVNQKWLDVMGIDTTEKVYNEGIFSMIDYAMFTKMCDGMEL